MVGNRRKVGVTVLFALVVSFVVSVGGGSMTSALTNIGPSPGPHGGGTPRYTLEAKPQVTIRDIHVPLYLPNRPTSPVTVRITDFNYPFERNFSVPSSVIQASIKVQGDPNSTRTDFSGNRNVSIPANKFSYDSTSGQWKVVLHLNGRGGNSNHEGNAVAFRLQVTSPAGALFGIGGNQLYSTAQPGYFGGNNSTIFRDYSIPFATPCNIRTSTVRDIELHDLDSGHEDNKGRRVIVAVRNVTTGTTSYPEVRGNVGSGGVARVAVNFQPGHRYQLVLTGPGSSRGIWESNTLIYKFPYDNISYAVSCDWSISQDAAYIQKYNSAGNLTGGRLGASVDAVPGERYGFFYRWRNDGPHVTNKSINIMRNYNYPTSSSGGWQRMTTVGVGQSPGSLIYNGGVGHTGTIPESALGSSYCMQTGVAPRSSTNNRQLNGHILCVNVPYNYELTPLVAPLGNVVESGAEVTVQPSVNNSGPTISRATEWELVRFTLTPTQHTIPSGGENNSRPCNYFAAGNCSRVDGDTGEIFDTSPATTPLGNHGETIDELEAGSRVCFALSVRPFSANPPGSNQWRHSTPQCVTVGKKPKVQIRGGDLAARGRVSANTTTKGSSIYGSWGEYSVLAQGAVSGLASAAAWADPDAPGSNINLLTFTNNSATPGNYSSTSYWAARPLTLTADRVKTLDAAQNVGTVNLPGSRIPNRTAVNQSVVIVASGNVTINQDIIYSTSNMSSISDIPQVVILSENGNINIRNSVSRIDAWLLAPNGYINTCSDYSITADLSTSRCGNELEINGPVVANELYLRRTAGSGTGDAAGDPAETINLRADAYLWAYLQSSGRGSAQTVFTTEMAPRF